MPELFFCLIVFAEQIKMPPGGRRVVSHRIEKHLSVSGIFDLLQLLGQVKIIPANDAVFDGRLAGFFPLLVFFLCLQKLAQVAPRHGICEAMNVLDPIQLLFNGLSQPRVVDDLENKERFRDLSKGLQCPIEGRLFRVGVEPPKQVGGCHLLQLTNSG